MKTISRRRPVWAVFTLALACVCATAALPTGNAERGPLRRTAATVPAETEARVIVKYKADSTLMRALSTHSGSAIPPRHAQELGGRLGLALTDGRTIGARAQVLKGQGLSSQALADRLAAQSDVEYAVVDGRMQALAAPNDPLYPNNLTAVTPAVGQWYLRAPTSAVIVDPTSVVSSINAEAAWAVTTGSSSVVVAVLDTGVRKDHPDLRSKLLAGYDFVTASFSNDGDGADADPSDPGDYTSTQSSSWHGTETAGLIGASTNNGVGMASVGRDVMLLPVRVLGIGGGFDSDIQAAMLWAGGLSASPVANPTPAKVINLSLGAPGACSAAYLDVLRQLHAAGIVVVAAAGNEGIAVGTPANCQGTANGVAYGVIAVAGIRHAGTKVGYSDLGPEIAISAPAGNCVNTTGTCLFPLLTTSNKGTTTPVSDANGGSIYTSGGNDASLGTSFSAPLVAGTVGLMLSINPVLTPSQVLRALQFTARQFPSSGAPPVQDVTNGPLVPVAACTAPTSTAQSSECYCTSGTCGAGMLDTGAATVAASTINAHISASASPVAAGATVALDASGSWPSGGSAISTYQWAITGGSTLASLASSTSASASLVTRAAGTVTVTLTVTDTRGHQGTATFALAVTPAPVQPISSGGGSGGGATGMGWLLAWFAAVIGVWAVTPGSRRRLTGAVSRRPVSHRP